MVALIWKSVKVGFFFFLVRCTSSVVVIRVFLFPLLRQGFGFSLENPEYCVLV